MTPKKSVSLDKYKEMEKFLQEELKRRDNIISDLEFQNKILLKSALKESEKNVKLSKHAKSLLDIHKKLNEKLRFDKKTKQ